MYPDMTFADQKHMLTKVNNQTGDDSDEDSSGEDDSDVHYVHMYLPDDEPRPQPTDPLLEIYTSPPTTFIVKWGFISLHSKNRSLQCVIFVFVIGHDFDDHTTHAPT